jgi:hypothetical protein
MNTLGVGAAFAGVACLVLTAGCGSPSSSLDRGSGATGGPDGGAGLEASGATGSDEGGASPGSVAAGGDDAAPGGDGGPGSDGSGASRDAQASSDTEADAGSDGGEEAAPDAASDGSGGDANSQSSLCTGGPTYPASNSAGSDTQVNGYGAISTFTSAQNQIVALDTTLTVPTQPAASGTLFLWPGLQPDGPGSNDLPLNNGVLQPVLTWGPTCAPNSPGGDPYGSWWVSAQYVNTYLAKTSPDYADYGGCHGGPGMDVEVGDNLDISMILSGTNWVQTVTDARSGASVTYTIDMLGQEQDIAEFVIEGDSQEPVSDVIFTSTTLTFASSEPSACQPHVRGNNDYFSAPQASSDGLHCCIQKLILRAQGVAATSPDSP